MNLQSLTNSNMNYHGYYIKRQYRNAANKQVFIHETSKTNLVFLSKNNEWIFSNKIDADWGFFKVRKSIACPMSDTSQWFFSNNGVWEETDKISAKFGVLSESQTQPTCDCWSSLSYSGEQTKTASGFTCQNWSDSSPHMPKHRPSPSNHNYCRIPGNPIDPIRLSNPLRLICSIQSAKHEIL